MTDTPHSISELISRFGTLTNFAVEVDVGYEAVRQMRTRESIAPEHWTSVVDASAARNIPGITFEWLAEQRAKRARASA